MFDLSGRKALVTGASGSIGGGIARALHQQGATVGISGTRREALEALAAELGDRVHVLPCDLADGAAVDELVPSAEAAMGDLDILVNNAGLTRDTLFVRMTDEDWNKVIAVNLTAAFQLSARGAVRDDAPPARADHLDHLGGRASPAMPGRATTPPPRRG